MQKEGQNPANAATRLTEFSWPFAGQNLMMAGVRLQAHAVKAALRYQIEMLSFLKHRCEQDLKLLDDLTGSDEFNDAFDVLASFWQNAATEYTNEAGKVAAIGSKVASETARQVRREADTALEDAAAATLQ